MQGGLFVKLQDYVQDYVHECCALSLKCLKVCEKGLLSVKTGPRKQWDNEKGNRRSLLTSQTISPLCMINNDTVVHDHFLLEMIH
jgi:hypothetical protein